MAEHWFYTIQDLREEILLMVIIMMIVRRVVKAVISSHLMTII